MSEQDNTAIVQEIYNSFKAGNITALLARMAQDISWELPEMTNVPFSGKRQSRDAVAEFFAMVGASQESLRFEPQTFVAQDDRVVSIGEYEWRVVATKKTFTGKFAHVFTIRDGLVTAFHEFTDTAAAERAYQQAMSA
jgi:ketosteroid isomerase-like protein